MNTDKALAQIRPIVKAKIEPVYSLPARSASAVESLFIRAIHRVDSLEKAAKVFKAIRTNKLISKEVQDNLTLNLKNKVRELINSFTDV